MKWWKTAGIALISLICLVAIILFECNSWPVGSSIGGIILGFSLPATVCAIQDLFDNTHWKESQRKLKRGGFISDNTIIRISFAYLFRIKVGNKYLLVRNNRGTKKFQPVGGVYKLKGKEKIVLKNLFNVMDDDKIPIDKSSLDDYRLRMESKHLRKFVERFDDKARREQIINLSREFKEELIETGIVDWKSIKYRFCGRHMTDLRFSEHFQIYELLLADVVELLPTADQERDLQQLAQQHSDIYYYATANEIESLGIDVETGKLEEIIGDHSKKVVQENEGKLMIIPGSGDIYTVDLG